MPAESHIHPVLSMPTEVPAEHPAAAGARPQNEPPRVIARVRMPALSADAGPTPAVVRAVAKVPGASPVPRRPPPWPPIPQSAGDPQPASVPPRPLDPAVVPRTSKFGAPQLRAAAPVAPTEPRRSKRSINDPPSVRKKGFARRLAGRAALPLVTALVAAFVVGSGYLALADYRSAPDEVGRWRAFTATGTAIGSQPLDGSATGVRPPGDPFGDPAVASRGSPTRVRITAIGLDSPLEPLHLAADGTLTPPRGFAQAGWYADGTAPGDVGPSVIAGHVDSKAGPAVFSKLRELTPGDRVEVTRGGTVVRFTVTRTAWYPKAKFPSTLVYGPTPDRQLRLITCGGVFDHRLRSYNDNLVVYAVAG